MLYKKTGRMQNEKLSQLINVTNFTKQEPQLVLIIK